MGKTAFSSLDAYSMRSTDYFVPRRVTSRDPEESGPHSMLDGQFLYFLVACLLCTVGLDLLYEVLQYMFEDNNTESTRVQILLAYICLVFQCQPAGFFLALAR